MVSVIIPNYNHAQYLHQRIESVLNQTYQDIELILLDDCSADSSRQILESYRTHPKVSHIVFNDQNSGSTFKQWKRGLELAKGDWIWIAESDDYCNTNFVESVLKECNNNQCDLGYAQSIPVDERGDEIKTLNYKTVGGGRYNGVDFLNNFLLGYNYMLNASSVILKKELLHKNLTHEVISYRLFGDWLVWIKACLISDICFVSFVENYHRCHTNTVRTKSELMESGVYKNEFSQFRYDVCQTIGSTTLIDKEILIEKNRNVYAHEIGRMGCALIKNKRWMESIPYILKATVKLRFNLYYVKSALYWVRETYAK